MYLVPLELTPDQREFLLVAGLAVLFILLVCVLLFVYYLLGGKITLRVNGFPVASFQRHRPRDRENEGTPE